MNPLVQSSAFRRAELVFGLIHQDRESGSQILNILQWHLVPAATRAPKGEIQEIQHTDPPSGDGKEKSRDRLSRAMNFIRLRRADY
jgi:hypothetical protein